MFTQPLALVSIKQEQTLEAELFGGAGDVGEEGEAGLFYEDRGGRRSERAAREQEGEEQELPSTSYQTTTTNNASK